MNTPQVHRPLHRIVALLMALALVAGFRPVAGYAAEAVPQATAAVVDPGSAVIGAGPEKAVCLLCSGTILAAGGSTIFGLVVVAGIFPEAVIGCAAVCALAFS